MDGHSRLDSIKTPKVERVLRKQFHHCREYVTGTLCLTDRHLIFIEPTGTQETWLLYHHILNVERKALTTKGYPLLIDCKTFQQLNLIIPRESDCLDIMDTIKNFSQPESYRDLFAFQYRPLDMEPMKRSSGWVLYDSGSEYSRMDVPNQYWKYTNLNERYEICDTYSSSLYVPVTADNAIITGSVKFRSRGRLPVLSYYYSPKKTALCRSSQPLVGLRGRSVEDEQMIQCIVNANPNADVMYMIDTRPKINAMANKAKGKGYESTDHYTNVIYEFFNIHNIHVMRESLQKLVEASCSPKETLSGFLLGIENSGWLKHIHLVLEASIFSAKALCLEGRSVLVHCSDGWDRTAQTCALVSLLLDPHYRTLHGFMILVEKEWLSFGHKFSIRSGHLAGDSRESSPIFTQFLDCVWQIMIQFPTAFQFNEHFLVTLHDHIYSCQFGTFLGNCERDRVLNMFSDQTYSFWGYVWAHLDDFINPLYSAASAQEELLLPNTDVPQLSFWLGLYCRYPLRQHVCELSDEVMGSLKQQNTCLTEHIKFVQQNIEDLKVQLTQFEDENAHIVDNSTAASTDSSQRKEEDEGDHVVGSSAAASTDSSQRKEEDEGDHVAGSSAAASTDSSQRKEEDEGDRVAGSLAAASTDSSQRKEEDEGDRVVGSSAAASTDSSQRKEEDEGDRVVGSSAAASTDSSQRKEEDEGDRVVGSSAAASTDSTQRKEEEDRIMNTDSLSNSISSNGDVTVTSADIVSERSSAEVSSDTNIKVDEQVESATVSQVEGTSPDTSIKVDEQVESATVSQVEGTSPDTSIKVDEQSDKLDRIDIKGKEERQEEETGAEMSSTGGKEGVAICDNGCPERVDGSASIDGKESIEESSKDAVKESRKKRPKPLGPLIPPCTMCDSAITEETSVQKDPTEVMSPRSYSVFKNNLIHIPEMNLPWGSMRNATKCMCGVTFSYSVRKYHCSHCGCVVCGSCGNNQAPLPWQSTPKPHRVCKSCFKISKKVLLQEETVVAQIT